MKEEIKNEIVQIVSSNNGCKASQLIPALSVESIKSDESILDLVDELISEGRLIGIDYVLSSMPYRTKTFLLPPCDEVQIRN